MAYEFQTMLKKHRHERGFSQLDLAMECGCSQRHISFMESGRSLPSRTMLVALSEAMDIPSRQRNELFLAAGFAPAYSERSLSDPEMAVVQAALDQMLQAQNPYPAFVFDWRHIIIAANEAGIALQLFLFDVDRLEALPDIAGNVLRGLLHPDGYRRHIRNWEQVASTMLRRFRAEVMELGRPDEGKELLEEFSSYPGVPQKWRQCADLDWRTPMLTVDVSKDGSEFSVFSILSSLGAPYDITLQEVRVESFYPADDAARRFFDQVG